MIVAIGVYNDVNIQNITIREMLTKVDDHNNIKTVKFKQIATIEEQNIDTHKNSLKHRTSQFSNER